MSDVLSLLLSESALALSLVLEEDGALARQRVVLVAANLDRFVMYIIFLKKGDDVLALRVKGKAAQAHPRIISQLKSLVGGQAGTTDAARTAMVVLLL